jgi:hypothetical protein
LAHRQKNKVETPEAPQNRSFFGKMEPPPLAHLLFSFFFLILLWAKHMGIKRSAIGNTLGEQIGNLMETHWELERNILGTKEK